MGEVLDKSKASRIELSYMPNIWNFLQANKKAELKMSLFEMDTCMESTLYFILALRIMGEVVHK